MALFNARLRSSRNWRAREINLAGMPSRLAMINSKLVLESSAMVAERLSAGTADEAEFVGKAFAALLGIEAGAAELDASRRALAKWRSQGGAPAGNDRSHFVWALMNHNDFVTLR